MGPPDPESRCLPRNAPAPSPESRSDDITIRELLSYRIHRLANALSQGAARRYRAEFDVSLMEWRTLALLGDYAPLTLKDLARHSGLDKSLASRTVSGLVERRLVTRTVGADDAREVSLRLSAAGRRVFEGLMRAARARNDVFLAALSAEERAMLDAAIDKLTAVARQQAKPEAWSEAAAAPRRPAGRAARTGRGAASDQPA
ncbi:winged helix-turn-helix transcriptional regulator [Roseomonas hellenica]|nr:winged helix-turn-helix transcriptional regulator [Plastoroseomonas hellenica]